MTVKTKRRSLRCGGRPKADFGSFFTSYIAPVASAAGSIVDSAVSKHQVNNTNNNQPKVDVEGIKNLDAPNPLPSTPSGFNRITIPNDPTKMKLGGRKKCWIGAAIGAATSIASSIFGNSAKKKQMRLQKSMQDWQDTTQEANAMTQALNNSSDYQEDYLRQFRTAARLGKTLGAKGIYITDGGDATKVDNNTYLLQGGSHEDINETGQTGIGINVGGNEVEAEGGEVAQKKNGALRIFSAQPILGNGMSPAQAILRGYDKDKVFAEQQDFKKRNGLKDDGSKARQGTAIPYSRIHINNDGTFTDTLDGKNYTTSATNGEDVVITGKANHWKEAGKKDTSSYYDPIGAVNFTTAAAAPILNFTPSNIYGSIRDSKNTNDFLRHYMMNDTGGFLNTEYAKEHPYLSLGVNAIGDIGLGIVGNKIANILRNPMNYGKYGYKLNKLYKKAGLLDRGDYRTIQQNYDKNLDVALGNRPFENNWYEYPIEVRNKAVNKNPDLFYTYITPDRRERDFFKYSFNKKAPKYHGQVIQPTHNGKPVGNPTTYYGYSWGSTGFANKVEQDAYYDLMNHNPEYYKFLEEVNYPKVKYPWNEQRTVDEFLKRQQTSLRGVYANDKETAKNYLTTIKSYRGGGDRLNTNGGLYTSNSRGIANAFKNPNDGISNGYIGKLFYDFDIDKSKPIADQLRAARMKVVRGGHNNVFAGTKHYKESIEDARKKGAIAIEDNYGRSNGDILNVTERAYLPSSAKEDKITLQNLEEYLNQTNKSGRWNTDGVDFQKGDENYFIPREYNRFDDFIREARIFMKPRKAYDFDKETKFMKDINYRTINRTLRRNHLLDKSRRLQGKDKIRNFDIHNKIDIFDYMDAPFRYGGVAKYKLGGSLISSRPVKGMRHKALYGKEEYDQIGGELNPVVATAKWRTPSFVTINTNATTIPNFNKVSVPNLPYTPPTEDVEVPYRGLPRSKSHTIFTGGDYVGLGIDSLAALSTGLINYNAAGKYYLPDKAPIISASKLPTNYNIAPQVEEIKRQRDRLSSQVYNNTSSSVAALNRANDVNLTALEQLSKLYATKENEENKMLTEDAKNQQAVAIQNAQNELARQSEIAKIKNDAVQSKAQALNVGLSGLSQAWTNFWTAGRTAYEDDQSRRAMIASSKEASPTRLLEMGYNLSPQMIAGLYNASTDERTKNFYLSMLTDKERRKYGIN